MRVLLSTVGSRGDVQPMIALGLELRAQGHQACLCAPPDFRDLVECDGLPFEPFRYYQYGERVLHLDGCVEVDAAYYDLGSTLFCVVSRCSRVVCS